VYSTKQLPLMNITPFQWSQPMGKNYTIERIAGEPIILGTTLAGWKAEIDIPLWAEDLYAMLDATEGRVTYIGNLLAGKPWSLDELIRTANAVAIGRKPVFQHQNIHEVLIVTQHGLVKLAAVGLQSDLFGRVPARAFESVEEAFAHARGNPAG
jgi:hypothetical protein